MNWKLAIGLTGVTALIVNLPVYAQSEEAAEPEHVLDRVSVVGTRFDKSADSDLAPEFRFDSGDIQAVGAGSIEELLEELGPQIGSSRGRGGERPIILVDGVRIASFREIRNYPPESIERMDVLPEEAALKYGYGANQRVINFVLKSQFSAWTHEAEFGGSTQGNGFETEIDSSLLRLADGKRLSLDGEIETNSGILESDRGLSDRTVLLRDNRDSLTAETEGLSLGGSYHKPFESGLRLTLSGDLEGSESHSYLGRSEETFSLPADNPFNPTDAPQSFTRSIGVPGALERDSSSLSGNLNLSLVRRIADWSFTSTSSIGREETTSTTDRTPDTSAYQDALDDLAPSVSPDTNITPFLNLRSEETSRTSNTLTTNLLASGNLIALPAGDVSSSVSLDLSHVNRTSETRLEALVTETDLSREIAKLQTSLDIPLLSAEQDIPGVDNLMLNLSGNLSEYSDFGTLSGYDVTLTYSPIERLRLISSYTYEEGAPSMAQLGDTVSETPFVEVFDFVTGQSVLATQIDGGNPDLKADQRRVIKLGGELEPFEELGVRLRVNYVDTKIEDPIGSFPSIDNEVQAAFPDRFTRASDGTLISYDIRPINFGEETRRDLSTNLFWSKTLKPPESSRDAAPAGGGKEGGAQRGSRPPGGGRPHGGQDRSGRITVFLNHNWHLENRRLLAEGFPVQDFLNGSVSSGNGGSPEHELSLYAGYSYQNFGSRLNVSWQSGTEVIGETPASSLSFSELTTLDLRLFYTANARSTLAKRFKWMEGARLTLEIDNLFDERLEVRTGTGETPERYTPFRLDPVGRAIMVSFRQQF